MFLFTKKALILIFNLVINKVVLVGEIIFGLRFYIERWLAWSPILLVRLCPHEPICKDIQTFTNQALAIGWLLLLIVNYCF